MNARVFLQDICEHPTEDAPRLIFADWLEDKDDPLQAEFIRVQCRLDGMFAGDPDWVDLSERQEELIAALSVRPRPEPPSPGAGLEWDTSLGAYRRGFLDELSLYNPEFSEPTLVAAIASAVVVARREGPATELGVYGLTPDQVIALVRHPVVETLSSLILQPTDPGDYEVSPANADEVARAVAGSPRLANLRDLRLFVSLTDAGIAALANSPHLRNLTTCAVDFLRATPDGLATLGRAEWFRRVRHFIPDGRVNDRVLDSLSAFPPCPALRQLYLGDAHFQAATLARFAASDAFPALCDLTLGGTSIKRGGMKALASGSWPLAAYSHRAASLNDNTIRALATARWLPTLRVLDLGGNDIGPAGIQALAGASLGGLRQLNLEYNPLGAEGLLELATGGFTGLTRLSLAAHDGERPYTTEEITQFLTRMELPALRHLELTNLPVGAAGARALAKNPSFARLTRLHLEGCRIGEMGAKALFNSPQLAGLIELDLSDNQVKKAAALLADPAVLPRLGLCNLTGNRLPANVVRQLAGRAAVRTKS